MIIFSSLMVNRRISKGVKLAAVKIYENQYLSLSQILECCQFSRATFFHAIKIYRETGGVAKPRTTLDGRPHKLHRDDLDYVLTLIKSRPDYFLDKLLNLVQRSWFISVHFTTIFRELEQAAVSHKKLQIIAEERNEPLRADLIQRVA